MIDNIFAVSDLLEKLLLPVALVFVLALLFIFLAWILQMREIKVHEAWMEAAERATKAGIQFTWKDSARAIDGKIAKALNHKPHKVKHPWTK
ncbi:MAG TPA: hypothetical protein VIM08_01200 [Arthrobacter sp.]